MNMEAVMKSGLLRRVVSAVAVVVVTSVLAGCIVEPAGPHFYHPHPYWYR
jgi:hypothetical protein